MKIICDSEQYYDCDYDYDFEVGQLSTDRAETAQNDVIEQSEIGKCLNR